MTFLEQVQNTIDKKNLTEKKSTEEETKDVKWYVDKFKSKMSGSSFETAIGWIAGIGKAISDKEKTKVLKGIMKDIDIPKKSDAKKYEKHEAVVERKLKKYPWAKSALK